MSSGRKGLRFESSYVGSLIGSLDSPSHYSLCFRFKRLHNTQVVPTGSTNLESPSPGDTGSFVPIGSSLITIERGSSPAHRVIKKGQNRVSCSFPCLITLPLITIDPSCRARN